MSPYRELVFRTAPYHPLIKRVEGQYIYYLTIESGFASASHDLPITEKDVGVLMQDFDRYYLLYVALTLVFKPSDSAGADTRYRDLFDTFLHSPEAAMYKKIEEMDVRYHANILNLARLWSKTVDRSLFAPKSEV